MEMKFCQSCGMPLTNEILGTNADGTFNEDYCTYCYKDGKFTQDNQNSKYYCRLPWFAFKLFFLLPLHKNSTL